MRQERKTARERRRFVNQRQVAVNRGGPNLRAQACDDRRSDLQDSYQFVLWDNIRRGAEIACPHIERSLTEDRMIDRVLGYSRADTVPTHTVQVFTGNRIVPKGDMCSRSFTITLDARRPDPEARTFTHPDPLEWTRANRPRILGALYTVLVAGVRCRPPDVAAKSHSRLGGSW
jgi:hypothetical protein